MQLALDSGCVKQRPTQEPAPSPAARAGSIRYRPSQPSNTRLKGLMTFSRHTAMCLSFVQQIRNGGYEGKDGRLDDFMPRPR